MRNALPAPSIEAHALPDWIRNETNPLADHYRHFRVAERLLLTGHSHQAWPDCARDAHLRAFDDAAELVDEKWSRCFAQAERVQAAYANLLDDPDGSVALASNTHDLLIRWLSALPLKTRPRLITTTGEFHTIRRQLSRLAEEGIEIVRIDATDPTTLAERMAAAVDDRTAAALVSSVLFESGRIVPHLDTLQAATLTHGAELMVDTYHHIDALPFSVGTLGLDAAFIVGGGYKYCQMGEGNAFLRVPPGCRLRPVITGWFAEFDALAAPRDGRSRVGYGEGASRFAGATYDPTSHYRGAAVANFFSEQGLDPATLRAISQHQVGLLAAAFDALDADPARIARDTVTPLDAFGGFLVLASPEAGALSAALRARGVATDYRGASLRFGPAPYLADHQLRDAMAALGEALRAD